MNINQIIAGLKKSGELLGFSIVGNDNITSLVYDSRKVVEGSLFVAVKGEKFDGHTHIEDALELGASAIIVQDPLILESFDSAILVSDSRRAMSSLANIFYNYPSKRLRVVGITGTNGKTTTSYILSEMLSAALIDSGLIGTIKYRVGNEELVPTNTTPEAIDLAGYFNEMVKAGQSVALMEVSSHALQLDRATGISFEVGIFMNLTRDHLDFHRSMESYYQAKKLLFKNPATMPVINVDDIYGQRLIAELPQKCLTFALDSTADVMALDPVVDMDGLKFTLRLKDDSFKCKSSLLGMYNLYNIIAAAAAAHQLGISSEFIQKGIELAVNIPGRFEVFATDEKIYGVVDYAHTDDALGNLLNGVRRLATAGVITVFGCGGDRDKGKRPLMGKVASTLSDQIIVTSDNPRSEDPELIIQEIMQGIVDKESCIVMPDRHDAILEAFNMAKRGDIVVVAGKGHEDYQLLGSGKIDFDDRKEVVEAMSVCGLHIVE